MEACVREVKIWLCEKGLVLNENKSEAIWSQNMRTPITISCVNICGQLVDTSAVIRDLGFVMDDHLSMESQVSNIMSQRILSPDANCQDTIISTHSMRFRQNANTLINLARQITYYD